MKLSMMRRWLMPFVISMLLLPAVPLAEGDPQVIRKAQKNIVVKQVQQKSLLGADAKVLQNENKFTRKSTEKSQRKTTILISKPIENNTLSSYEPDELVEVEVELWKLYNKGLFHKVDQLIAQTKRKHQFWQQPKQLLSLMKQVRSDRLLRKAQKKGDYKVALKLYKNHPKSFSCKRLGWVFFLAEAQARSGLHQQAFLSYQRIMVTCSEMERIAAIEHAQGVLLQKNWQRLVRGEHKKRYRGEAQMRMQKVWYKYQLQKLQYASDHGLIAKAVKLSQKMTAQVIAYDDASAAEILGWAYLKAELFGKALTNFKFSYQRTRNPDMLRGQALALGAMGNEAELDKLLTKHKVLFEQKKYMVDILPTLIQQSFQVEAYEKAARLTLKLQKLRSLSLGEKSILSWAYYHLNKYSDAAASFESLYRFKPDDEVARGLYYSLFKQGDTVKMDALSDEFGGVFAGFVMRNKANSLYYKQQFLAAHARADEYSDVLKNIDKPYLGMAFLKKNSPNNGALRGVKFSRMKLEESIIEGRNVIHGVHELKVRVVHLRLDASVKNLIANAEVGTIAGGAYAIPKPQTIYQGNEWSIGYRYEDAGTTYAEVGQFRVPNAIKKDEWKFRLGYSRNFDDRSLQIEVYRQPLRETLLSYIGMTDPYLGVQRWGQVSRNGVSASIYQDLPYNMSLNSSIVAEQRRGHNVKNNNNYSAYLAIPYNLKLDAFNYFSVGPYVRREHFNMDQNHFTVGHGGYYSPQFLMDAGLSFNALTKDSKAWMLALGGSIGRQNTRTSASLKLPLTPGVAGVPYAMVNQKDIHYELDAAVVLALSDYVRFNAEYKSSRSWSRAINAAPAFSERSFMLSLTIHFEERGKKLLQADIPSYRLQPLR